MTGPTAARPVEFREPDLAFVHAVGLAGTREKTVAADVLDFLGQLPHNALYGSNASKTPISLNGISPDDTE